ncbi:ParA family protein [Nocardia sp. IFM 10818]
MTRNRRAKQKNRQRAEATGLGYFEARALRLSEKDTRSIPEPTFANASHAGRGIALAAIGAVGATGRTTALRHIGSSLAAGGLQVLLLDMDPRLDLTRICGVEPRDGFQGVDPVSLIDSRAEMVHRFEGGGVLRVLPCRQGPPGVMDVDRLRLLVRAGVDRFDLVLVDLPPWHGEPVVDVLDGVFSCVRFDPSLLVERVEVTYSDRYRAYRARLQQRAVLLDQLDFLLTDDLENLYTYTGMEAEDWKVISLAEGLVSSLGEQEGIARFGSDWAEGSQRWLDVVRGDQPEGWILDPRDVDAVPIGEWPQAGFADLAAAYQSQGGDVEQVVSWHDSSVAVQNIRDLNEVRGCPVDVVGSRHLGVVVTFLNPRVVIGAERRYGQLFAAAGGEILLPPMPAISDDDVRPDSWRHRLNSRTESSPAGVAEQALARELWRRAGAGPIALSGRAVGPVADIPRDEHELTE